MPRDISQSTALKMLAALRAMNDFAWDKLGWAADQHPDVQLCRDAIEDAKKDQEF
jgi:hypothetical protein